MKKSLLEKIRNKRFIAILVIYLFAYCLFILSRYKFFSFNVLGTFFLLGSARLLFLSMAFYIYFELVDISYTKRLSLALFLFSILKILTSVFMFQMAFLCSLELNCNLLYFLSKNFSYLDFPESFVFKSSDIAFFITLFFLLKTLQNQRTTILILTIISAFFLTKLVPLVIDL